MAARHAVIQRTPIALAPVLFVLLVVSATTASCFATGFRADRESDPTRASTESSYRNAAELQAGPASDGTTAADDPGADPASPIHDRTEPGDRSPAATGAGDFGGGDQESGRASGSGGDGLAQPRVVRLTDPGCCTGLFWSPDGRILFLDDPPGAEPLGIWSVDPGQPEEPARLFHRWAALFTEDMAFEMKTGGSATELLPLSDGEVITVPAGGRPIRLSPGGGRAGWTTSPDVPYERRIADVWVANLGDTAGTRIASVPRGSIVAWISETSLLVRGRDALSASEDVLWTVDAGSGARNEIARGERLRGEAVSPGGRWIAFYIVNSPQEDRNGMWLVSPDGSPPRRMANVAFGAYRWRDADRLLVVPLDYGAPAHRLLSVDARDLNVEAVTDPALQSFRIANGEWSPSPDGRWVAFVEASDKSIRAIELP